MTDIFAKFKKRFQENFAAMVSDADTLFSIAVDKDAFWNLYLDSFPEGTNPIFRERREYDCSCCRRFVKTMGNVAVIKNGKVHTMWEFDAHSDVFQPVVDALDAYLKAQPIEDMFISKEKSIGTDKNHEILDNGTVLTWEHFYLTLPKKFVDTSSHSVEKILGDFRDTRNVFKRSLDEITEDAVLTVLELISSNSLYRGAEHKAMIEQFLQYKRTYDALTDDAKVIFAWEYAKSAGMGVGRIRNHAIGTLLVNISEGEDLNVAVKKYDAIMAPANYKRTTAIATPRMIEAAKQTVTELGFMSALPRRFATLNDINVNNVLFANRDAASRMVGGMDVFDVMMAEAPRTPQKFNRVEEISIEDFINNVLPTAQSIEAYLENRHASNMCSLIAPQDADAPTMFKWDNPFSWAYSNNVTDSDITQRVQAAGGRTDGVLRFSHSWNYEGMRNASLMDLHVFMPGSNQKTYNANGKEIHDFYGNYERVGWNNRQHRSSGGVQDVDYTAPAPVGYIPVENTTFPSMDKLPDGVYIFKIHNWQQRTPNEGGFKAEIAFGGEVYKFVHKKPLAHKEWVTLAKLEKKDGEFKILEMMENDTTPMDVWNLKTNNFVPVSAMMYSPNYWDKQQGIGNKHYMFMLKDCVNPETPNGFYNEFLKNELTPHRKVFEMLGSKMAVASVDDQLSGLGFSSTKRNDLVVKVKGQTERIMRIKF